LRELRDHTALTELSATHLTDVGVLELHDLTALTRLCLVDTSTTKAGQDALKAALSALTISK